MTTARTALEAALSQCDAELAALEARAAELLSNNARHMLFELCEPDFAWGHPEHNYLTLEPWQDRDAKLELVDASMIEYGEPTGIDGLGGRTMTITRWGRAVSKHCLPLLLASGLRPAHSPAQHGTPHVRDGATAEECASAFNISRLAPKGLSPCPSREG